MFEKQRKALDVKRPGSWIRSLFARKKAEGIFPIVIIGAVTVSWWAIGSTVLDRCYNVDAWVASVLLLIPIISTACISFFAGKLRSASFVVSIDSAELDRINHMDDSITTHQVTLGVTLGSTPTEADVRVAEDFGLKQRADTMKTRYGFSDRETEVLTMLAKARDAKYISDTLYISQNTVKAHIYNIYHKAGVHTRQELIDLFEESLLTD